MLKELVWAVPLQVEPMTNTKLDVDWQVTKRMSERGARGTIGLVDAAGLHRSDCFHVFGRDAECARVNLLE